MSEKAAAMAIALLLALGFIPISGTVTTSSGRFAVFVPAVYDSSGEVFEVTVEANSNNSLIIQGPSVIDDDTISSIWSSVFVANILSSSPRWHAGFTVSFPANVKSIGGPSASLAMTLAILKILNNDEVNALLNYSITGAVNINGLTVSVGGIETKYRATKNAGLAGMVLPMGNSPDLLNGSEGALPVASVYELYLLSLGYATENGYFKAPVASYPDEIKRHLDSVYFYFRNNTDSNLTDVTRYLSYADEAYRRGELYTASSLAFVAYTRSRQALYSEMSLSEAKAKYDELKERAASLRDRLEQLEKVKINSSKVGLYDVELLSLAESRLWMCENLLESFGKSNYTDRAILAQSESRCITADLWADLAVVNLSEQPTIDLGRLNEGLETYLFYLDKFIWYVESLIKKLNATEDLSKYLSSLKETYELIVRNSEFWNLPLRLGLTTELAQNIAVFLDSFNLESDRALREFLAEEYRTWLLLCSRINLYQLDSLVSSFYLEYSRFMSDKDPLLAHQLASQAIVSLYPLVIYTKILGPEGHADLTPRAVSVDESGLSVIALTSIVAFIMGIAFGFYFRRGAHKETSVETQQTDDKAQGAG